MEVVYRHKWIIFSQCMGIIWIVFQENIQTVYGTLYDMVYMVVCRTIYNFFF
jgi:hypothetical protein